MSKPVDGASTPMPRGRRVTRKATRPDPPTASVGQAGPDPRPATRSRADWSLDAPLVRLLASPHLERVVPHLAPETLQQLIRYRGLDGCSELLACMAPAQLASVLDLDLWRRAVPAGNEQFDAERFGEWLETLVELGDATAARIVAGLDRRLVIAGLSRHIRVLDVASRDEQWPFSDEAPDVESTEAADLEGNVGGYAIGARRSDTWDAIVALLVALDAGYRDCFHAVMRGCRRLSDEGREIDGLDDLLPEPEQLMYDLSTEREERRSRHGYLSSADARAFLEMARRAPHARHSGSPVNPIVDAYVRATRDEAARADSDPQPTGRREQAELSSDDRAHAVAGEVLAALSAAGLAPGRPLALLESGLMSSEAPARLRALMGHLRDTDQQACLEQDRELAFLANALVAGCSIQSRSFGAREALDAVLATCNLGLDRQEALQRAARTDDAAGLRDRGCLLDPSSPNGGLVAAFQAGWGALHDMRTFVAERLIETLTDIQSVDRETQWGLIALRREMARQLEAGEPWRARRALDVIATLDGPAWAGLLGALDECPVLPAALTAVLERRTGAVSPVAFEFISTMSQVGQVRAFARTLRDILLG